MVLRVIIIDENDQNLFRRDVLFFSCFLDPFDTFDDVFRLSGCLFGDYDFSRVVRRQLIAIGIENFDISSPAPSA